MTANGDIQPYDLAQLVAYHHLRHELQETHHRRWVLIHHCQLAGDYATYDEARAAARQQGLNLLDCLIQQVGAEPTIIVS